MENAESVFTFADKIGNVRTPQDIVTLETQFAQDRMQAFVTQTQQLFNVIEKAIKKSERGAVEAGIEATPSPMATNFKSVQDHAMDFAKDNAESAFTFAGKICKAQTTQDILALQMKLAQDQMEAFAAYAQELYNLIGETLHRSARG
jgi:hypothetical protein